MNRKTVMTIRWGFVIVVGLLATQALSGDSPQYSHAVHLEQDLACADCHTMTEGGTPELNGEFCLECHDEAPEYTRPPHEELAVPFPHSLHADSLECQDCHAASISDSISGNPPILTHEACMKCHQEMGDLVPEASCATCHGNNPTKRPPGDHGSDWLVEHGRESQWRVFDDHGKDCTVCHKSDACTTCHRTRTPQSHTGLWRIVGHGPAAEWDREACLTCHQQGTCDRCHRMTRPLNHSGAWQFVHGLAAGTKTGAQCSVCHRQSDCDFCHSQGR